MGRLNKAKGAAVLIILLVLVVYVGVLIRNLNESERRTLQLKGEVKATNASIVIGTALLRSPFDFSHAVSGALRVSYQATA